MNGDGFCELIVYAPGNRALLLYGSNSRLYNITTFDSSMGTEFQSSAASFFSRGRTAGDFNKDTYGDLLVGCQKLAFLVSGNFPVASTFDVDTQLKFEDNAVDSPLEVSPAGDVNNDGYSDIMIQQPSQSSQGYTFLIFGTSSTLSSPFDLNILSLPTGITIKGGSNWYQQAFPVGDVNGDGFDDIICASPLTGTCVIIYGRNSWEDIDLTSLNSSNMAVIKGNSSFGASVGAAGDVNGDGYDDFLIATVDSVVYLFYGSNSFPAVISMSSNFSGINITGLLGSYFGFSMTGTDLNGDGLSDIIISDYEGGVNKTGEVYIYFGSSSLPSTIDYSQADVVLGSRDSTVDGSLGYMLTIGDFNGDGFKDLFASSAGTSMYILYALAPSPSPSTSSSTSTYPSTSLVAASSSPNPSPSTSPSTLTSSNPALSSSSSPNAIATSQTPSPEAVEASREPVSRTRTPKKTKEHKQTTPLPSKRESMNDSSKNKVSWTLFTLFCFFAINRLILYVS